MVGVVTRTALQLSTAVTDEGFAEAAHTLVQGNGEG
jgi:hypothetical protein